MSTPYIWQYSIQQNSFTYHFVSQMKTNSHHHYFTHSFLLFTSVLHRLSLSLWWGLSLSLHFSLLRCLQQNLRHCLLILAQLSRSLLCFALPVCVCLRVRLQRLTWSLLIWIGVAFIAQIPHVEESLHQTLDKVSRACLRALTETGHGEDDVVWLRVVARPISIWNHGSVTAEHLNSSGNLRGEMTVLLVWSNQVTVP